MATEVERMQRGVSANRAAHGLAVKRGSGQLTAGASEASSAGLRESRHAGRAGPRLLVVPAAMAAATFEVTAPPPSLFAFRGRSPSEQRAPEASHLGLEQLRRSFAIAATRVVPTRRGAAIVRLGGPAGSRFRLAPLCSARRARIARSSRWARSPMRSPTRVCHLGTFAGPRGAVRQSKLRRLYGISSHVLNVSAT